MTRCVAVIGPSQVGKSELVNRMAMLEGGRVAAGPPDDLRCVDFSYLGESWFALDCPGSMEFGQSGKDAMLSADAAVIVTSPDPEQAVLAATWIRLAERCGIPHLIFVNRMDECRARARDIIAALQAYSAQPVILRQMPIREGEAILGAVDLVSERAWRYREGAASELIEIPKTSSTGKRRGAMNSSKAFPSWTTGSWRRSSRTERRRAARSTGSAPVPSRKTRPCPASLAAP